MKKTRSLSLILVLSLLGSLLIAPSVSAQTATQPESSATKAAAFPVTGTGTAASGAVTFDGTFNVNRFRVQGGQLMAEGSLLGTVKEASGKTTTMEQQDVTLPVQSINGKAMPAGSGGGENDGTDQNNNTDGGMVGGLDLTGSAMLEMAQAPSCNILNLLLGPLHLNLLGLVVDLNSVVLNVTGQTGAGNLLGNLLCAVSGLLDHTGTLTVLTNLLNALLDIRRLGLA